MKLIDSIKSKVVDYVKKVHVAITFDDGKYYIRTHFIGKNGTTTEDKVFDLAGDKMPPIMIRYINGIQKKYSYVYTSTFLSTINAGSIYGCDDHEYRKMHIETDSIIKVCIDRKWSAYSSIYAVDELKHFFSDVGGIDFVFPQEIILKHLLDSRVIEGQQIYIVTTSSYAIATVFSEEGLLFSSHFIYKEDEDDLGIGDDDMASLGEMNDMIDDAEKEHEEIEEVLQLEDIDDSDIFDGGLEDLDSLDDIETPDFDDVDLTDKPVADENIDLEEETVDNRALFTKKDQLLCEFLHNSIEDFYKNSFYKSEFIKQGTIFDACRPGVNTGEMLHQYIVDELMLECDLEKIDLRDVLGEISIVESKAV
jgi:hypothetical protein